MNAMNCRTAGIRYTVSKIEMALLIGATALLADYRLASAAAAADSPSGAAVESVPELEEITVTATRREERLRDVPMSVTAYDQSAMDAAGVKGIDEIARLTPGLTFTSSGYGGANNIAIRGVSSSVGAATTGVYIDDTPIQSRMIGDAGASTNAFPTVFDLERVEVLRGPQGTLFGAGSEGGTIRFITPKPSLQEFSGYTRAEVTQTEYGAPSYEAGIAAGGPLVDGTLGFRASVFERHAGGWIDRADPISGAVLDKNINSEHDLVARIAVTYAPSAQITITPALMYSDTTRGDDDRFWANLSNPASGVFLNGNPNSDAESERFSLPSLAINVDLGSAALISDTSYFDRHNDNPYPGGADVTAILTGIFTGKPIALLPGYPEFTANDNFINTQRVFTQEVRLQSADSHAKLSWTAGVFYQNAKQHFADAYQGQWDKWFSAFFGVPTTTQQVLGLPLLPNNVILNNNADSTDKQTALFGELSYQLTSKLALTTGLRYSWTQFSFSNAADGPFNGGPSLGTGATREHPLTPKVALKYQADANDMLYASAAKGFRPGGANSPVPAVTCAQDLHNLGLSSTPSTYNSDSVWSYEVGSKSEFLGGRVRSDVSLYYIRWDNIQQSVFLPICTYSFLDNLGSAVSRGADLDFEASITRDFVVKLAFEYDDAKYTQRVTAGGSSAPSAPVFVSDGDRLPVPKYRMTLSPEYGTQLSSRYRAYIRGDFTYASGYPTFPGAPSVDFLPDGSPQRATRYVTMRSGLQWDKWDVSVVVYNLTGSIDKTYYKNQEVGTPLFYETAFRPRTIGVAGTLHF
jgi:iron complex outermembrane recepter protein